MNLSLNTTIIYGNTIAVYIATEDGSWLKITIGISPVFSNLHTILSISNSRVTPMACDVRLDELDCVIGRRKSR